MREKIWLSLLLLVIAIGGTGGALILSLYKPTRLHHDEEWVRALLQAGLVAILGIVTSAVLERFKDRIQQRRDRSKLQYDVLTGLSRAYMDVKLLRRKVQAAKKLTEADAVELNQIQVLFELHKRISPNLFVRSIELETHLKVMEKYLNKVANKSESTERQGFISDGFSNFAEAYNDAVTLIQNEIAGPVATITKKKSLSEEQS